MWCNVLYVSPLKKGIFIETAYKLNKDFTTKILSLKDVTDVYYEVGTQLILGENMIQLGNRSVKRNLKVIETYQNGLFYAIVPIGNISFEEGEKFIYQVDKNISIIEDQIRRIIVQISSRDMYLDIAWPGLPGIETTKFDIDLTYVCHYKLFIRIVTIQGPPYVLSPFNVF